MVLSFDPVRVALGEEEPLARRLLQDALVSAGYEVVAVADGFSLLETVLDAWDGRGPAIDLVVSEPFLGCYQTVEVLEELREHGWDAPFVVIDWGGDAGLRRRIRAAGGDTLDVDGGLDADLLLRLVEELLTPEPLHF